MVFDAPRPSGSEFQAPRCQCKAGMLAGGSRRHGEGISGAADHRRMCRHAQVDARHRGHQASSEEPQRPRRRSPHSAARRSVGAIAQVAGDQQASVSRHDASHYQRRPCDPATRGSGVNIQRDLLAIVRELEARGGGNAVALNDVDTISRQRSPTGRRTDGDRQIPHHSIDAHVGVVGLEVDVDRGRRGGWRSTCPRWRRGATGCWAPPRGRAVENRTPVAWLCAPARPAANQMARVSDPARLRRKATAPLRDHPITLNVDMAKRSSKSGARPMVRRRRGEQHDIRALPEPEPRTDPRPPAGRDQSSAPHRRGNVRAARILSNLGDASELRHRLPEAERAQAQALCKEVTEAKASWLAYACHAVAATPAEIRSHTS